MPTNEDIIYNTKPDLTKTDEHSESFAATGTVLSYTLRANALTHTLVAVVPNFTNAITIVVSIENSDGNEIYASSALAKNTTHVVATEKPLVGKHKVILTLTGVAGGSGGTVDVTWYLQG